MVKYAIKFNAPGMWCDGLYLCGYVKPGGVPPGEFNPPILTFDTAEDAEETAQAIRLEGKPDCVRVVEYNANTD